MKILSIKGRNLASFEGDFEVDFTQGELAETNLFAITGPTGSGKSTILDALCLGLFAKTPRLEKGVANISNKMQDISGEDIALNDPRQLLRRGTGEGYAEVTFVGVDKKKYKAQWKIRRAGDKSPGKFQATKHFIRDVETGREQNIDAKLTKIIEILGLSYEQFCRSILLPQGGFSAFLEAKPEDRSPLLEVLTGTEIYSTISKNVFVKSGEYTTQIKNLKIQLEGIENLSDDELSNLKLQKTDLEKIESQIGSQKKEAEDLQKWYGQVEKQENLLNDSLTEIKKNEGDLNNLKNIELQIELNEKSNAFKNEYIRYNSNITNVINSKESLAEKLKTNTLAKETWEQAQVSNQNLATSFESLKEKSSTELETIQKAKIAQNTLDSLIETHKHENNEFSERKTELSNSRSKLEECEQALAKSKITLDESRGVQKKANDDGIEKLSQNWVLWKQKIPEAIQLKEKQTELLEEQSKNQLASDQLKEELIAQKNLLAPLQKKNMELNEAKSAIEVEISKLNKNSNQELKIQENRLGQLEKAIELLKTQEELKTKKATNQTSLNENKSELKSIKENLKEIGIELGNKKAILDTLKIHFEINQDLETTLESLRSNLEKDQDCPLCGSTSHPLLEDDSYLKKQAEAKQSRLKIENAYAALEEKKHNFEKQETALITEAQKWKENLSALEIELNKVSQELDYLEEFVQSKSVVELEKELLETQTHVSKLQTEVEKAQKLDIDLKSKQQELEALRKEIEQLQSKLTELEKSDITAQAKVEKNNDDLRKQSQELSETQAHWETEYQGYAIGDWAHFNKAPKAFYSRLEIRISEYQNHFKNLEDLESKSDTLKHDLDKLNAVYKTALEEVEKTQKQVEIAFEKMNQQKQIRFDIYKSEDLNFTEINLNEKLKLEEENLKKHNLELSELKSKSASASGLLDESQKALESLKVELEKSEGLFKAKIVDKGLADDFETGLHILKTEFAKPEDWKTSALEQIQTAKEELNKSKATQIERQKNLETLQQSKPQIEGVDSPSLLVEYLDLLSKKQDENSQEKEEVLSKLSVDKANKDRNKETLAKIQKIEKEGETWLELNRLIGSSDGKVFRNIAQQYTLDLLVAQANKHLSSLSKRYQLAREDESLTLVIIDLNMGQARRPAHSLSGGESFLVSLGLALGLSGLSGQKASLESLFIDEGFGTLDPATLNIAMEALDALQAQGRKVGIITHVEGLRERISTQVRVESVGGSSKILVGDV